MGLAGPTRPAQSAGLVQVNNDHFDVLGGAFNRGHTTQDFYRNRFVRLVAPGGLLKFWIHPLDNSSLCSFFMVISYDITGR